MTSFADIELYEKGNFFSVRRFLPRLAASSLEKVLNDSGIHVQKDSSEQEPVEASDFVCEFFIFLCFLKQFSQGFWVTFDYHAGSYYGDHYSSFNTPTKRILELKMSVYFKWLQYVSHVSYKKVKGSVKSRSSNSLFLMSSNKSRFAPEQCSFLMLSHSVTKESR